MRDILLSLEPRFEYKGTQILNECEEINEITFVDRGEVVIGYELNKVKRFCLSKKDYCVIGGFNCVFDFTSEFIYLAKTDIHG